jgi:hypothetical protein
MAQHNNTERHCLSLDRTQLNIAAAATRDCVILSRIFLMLLAAKN